MSSTIKSDAVFSMITNYKYQRSISGFSVIETVHRHVQDDGTDEDKVSRRRSNLRWIKHIAETSQSAVKNISQLKLQNGDQLAIEQEKLRVLHLIGWNYKGNFHKPKFEGSYPELSFSLSTRIQDGVYYYVASYGIVRDVKDADYGSYNLFLTLEDALQYITEELHFAGQPTLYRHYFNDAFRRAAEEKKKGKKELTKEERDTVISNNRDRIEATVADILSENNVENRLRAVRRASDITTLSDFAHSLLIPQAFKRLEEAENNKRERERAEKLHDNAAINLDASVQPTPPQSVTEVALPTPEDVRAASASSVKNVPVVGVSSDSLPTIDPQEQLPSGGIVLDLDAVDSSSEDTPSPEVVEDSSTPQDPEPQSTSVEALDSGSVAVQEQTESVEDISVPVAPLLEHKETAATLSVRDALFDEHSDVQESVEAFEAMLVEEDGVVLTDDEIVHGLKDALPELFDISRLPVVEKTDSYDLESDLDEFLNEM